MATLRPGIVVALAATMCGACGAAPDRKPASPAALPAQYTLMSGPALPPLGIAARDGDARLGVALAVATEPGESALLAALVKIRLLSLHPGTDVVAAPGEQGYRIRFHGTNTAALTDLRTALLRKVTEAELGPVAQEVARFYLGNGPATATSRCEGRLSAAVVGTPKPTVASLEAMRQRNHVAARITVGAVVPGAQAEALGATWKSQEPYPLGPPLPEQPVQAAQGFTRMPGRELSLRLVLWTPDRERAIGAAEAIASDRTALRARIEAERLRLTEIQATVLPSGGACLLVRADATDEAATKLSFANLGSAPSRFVDELENLVRYIPASKAPRLRGGEVSETAEELAWWLLSREGKKGSGVVKQIEVVAPEARDTESSAPLATTNEGAADVRVKLESGHGTFHVVVGSPCGTLSEGSYNAGVGAWVAQAAALDAQSNGLTSATPIIDADGLGLYVQDTPSPNETAEELAFRLTSQALRSWYLPQPKAAAQARRELLSQLTTPAGDLLARLAQLRAPAHPSWVSALGTADALLRQPEGIISQMDAGPRAGPLRIAIVASGETQREAAVRAAALWKRDVNVKCEGAPQESVRPMPAAATPSETLLLGLPARGDRRLLSTWAALLSADTGPLAKSFEGLGLRRFSVSATGRDDARLLVVRIEGPPSNLPRAEEAVRKTLDRLRESAPTGSAIPSSTQPVEATIAARLESLYLAPTSTPAEPITAAALRAFASQFFKGDAIIRTP